MALVTVADYRGADAALFSDLEFYSAKLIKIQAKDGRIVPFVWNSAQKRFHARIERQRDQAGWVRAIALKARQLGVSTYVAGRYYHRTTTRLGQRSYILTHQDDATQHLFDIVKLMHDRMPVDYRHRLSTANANELEFASTNSGYRVGTAKNIKGKGRSLTLQNFHGSEVAFWDQARSHFAGAMSAVPKLPDTEIILESTANGIGGAFYEEWALAERGKSDFIPIFMPWFEAQEYRTPLRADYEPSLEEERYAEIFGLDQEQLCWFHFENTRLGGQPGVICPLMRQEYPATAAEAFQMSGVTSFIPSELILRARRWEAPEQLREIPRVLGCDIARGGKDSVYLIDRKGRQVGKVVNERRDDGDLVATADRIAYLLKKHPDIRRAFVDVTGMGIGVYDILRANGFEERVVAVNFGAAASEPNRYVNKRAEMWGRCREWLMDPGGADIPDQDDLHRDLAAPAFGGPAGCRYDANSRLQMEAKEKIKERLGFSPDAGDALCLTFAEIIPIEMPDATPKWLRDHVEEEAAQGDAWMGF